MESTSTYWYPVYKQLGKIEDLQNEHCVVNASQLKVMGRHKTDVGDAELLANWRLKNTLKASFITSLEIHHLRQLIRTRVDLHYRKTTVISQLKIRLEGFCPGITDALKNLNALSSQLFLQAWASVKSLISALMTGWIPLQMVGYEKLFCEDEQY
jgi:transposase